MTTRHTTNPNEDDDDDDAYAYTLIPLWTEISHPNGTQPFALPLFPSTRVKSNNSTSSSVNATTIGKYELLQAIYKSCPHLLSNTSPLNESTGSHHPITIVDANGSNTTTTTTKSCCDCPACTNIRRWVIPSIPTVLLRFQIPPVSSNDGGVVVEPYVWLHVRRVSYATKRYVHLIQTQLSSSQPPLTQLNHHRKMDDPLVWTRTNHYNNNNNTAMTTTVTLNDDPPVSPSSTTPQSSPPNDTWMGPWSMYPGDILQFRVVPEHFLTNYGPPTPLLFQLCSGGGSIQPLPIQHRTNGTSRSRGTAADDAISVDDDDDSSTSIMMNVVDPTTSTQHTNSRKIASQLVLYFVPKGTDMHPTIHIPKLQQNARERGATVLSTFHYSNFKKNDDKNDNSSTNDIIQQQHPTHFVISTYVTNFQALATGLGFVDVEEMSTYIQEHQVTCVTRDWATNAALTPYETPTLLQLVPGFSSSNRKRKRPESMLTLDEIRNRNRPISEVFRKLAKLHQDCPLYVNDDWKAYMFQLISGRLLHLDFVVTIQEIDRLSRLNGFGASTIQIIKDFVETGVCQRIIEFENDAQRKAMKVMMNIWGVGRARATELVNAGYRRIGDVQQALMLGTLHVDRNQYIGVLCYEDINERMPRTEVEAIAEIVALFVQTRYTTSAETMIMGSYRRGKETCGDVDILITHPDYIDTVPPNALGEIVDDLCSAGHVAFHLTYISGMKPELYETLPSHVAKRLTHPKSYGRSKEPEKKDLQSSWMGVMNSPLVPGKRRRVDIKFYPYAVRYFASLYFTGNGHFNRSMRLYATRKYNYKLSDHGLVDKSTERSIICHPTSERDIFDVLGLQWKEANERECFDDVEPYDSDNGDDDDNGKDDDDNGDDSVKVNHSELTREEIQRDNTEHVWID